jgi:DNA-binding PadR family transcriptional regulator
MVTELGIWEIAVLALLREAPMHPYQMQRLLRDRHKDEILALKRGSLYHAIARLLRAGLIAVEATSREGRRPERTTYRITRAGRGELQSALRKIVAMPRRESSEFMAAMSFLVHLTPAEAVEQLSERVRRLREQIDGIAAGLVAAPRFVERINLVESEYLLAMLRAELDWITALEDDIRKGKLKWNAEHIFNNVRAHREAAHQEKQS